MENILQEIRRPVVMSATLHQHLGCFFIKLFRVLVCDHDKVKRGARIVARA